MKTLHFQSTIVESEKVNPLFTKVKIHVAYENENRNDSFISRDSFEKAADSAAFCPIVGEFSETIDDFRGHGGKIEITDDEIKYIKTTVAYGCIGNEAPTWETVTGDDGTEKDYFTLTGYIWSSRFPELEAIIESPKSHSMELEVLNGKFESINGKKLYVIEDFVFSGFCILGDDVEPCFENSTISTYSLNKEKFKAEFTQMMNELKFSLQENYQISQHAQKGGNEMSEGNKATEFALTSEQLENELKRELAKSVTTDQWGYTYQDYYFVDYMPEQNMVIAMDSDDRSLVGFTYTIEGDLVTVDFTTEKRFKVEYVPMDVPADDGEEDEMDFNLVTKEKMNYHLQVKEKETEAKLTAEFETKVSEFEAKVQEFESKVTEKETALTELQSQFELIKAEKEELETFKLDKLKAEKEEQINAVFESVTSELTDEELAPFKEKAFEMEVEALKKELFALIGQKEFEKKSKFSAVNNKPMTMGLELNGETKIEASYASIIKKYNNK